MLDYFTLINFPNFNVLNTKQYIKLTPVSIYFGKHSCLQKPINYHINALMSSGLIDFWASKFRPRYPIKNNQLEPKSLSLSQIGGLITVCTYLILCSIVLLILEMISTNFDSIKIFLDFLTFNANKKHKLFTRKRIQR